MKDLLFILSFMACLAADAGEKDSTRWDFRVKGFDFEFGKAFVNTDREQAVNLLQVVTPPEERARYNYNNVIIRGGAPVNKPNIIRLSVVFSNDHNNYRYFFNKKELKFGIGYEIRNANLPWKVYDSIKLVQYPWVPATNTGMSYAYQCQYIHIAYQMASKPFLRYFALFGGVSGRFGMNTYKQIDMQDYYASTNGRQEENYNVGYFSTGAHLGLKYNFSCDLNFFIQCETGLNFYGNDIGGTARFSGGGFGMRYKIIDDQDRPKYELMKYW